MNRSPGLKNGFKLHYEWWLENHPDAISYDKLMHYIIEGDEFGRPVSIRQLAKSANTSRNTMFLRWLPKIYSELDAKNIKYKRNVQVG
jgi:hypothetical protein